MKNMFLQRYIYWIIFIQIIALVSCKKPTETVSPDPDQNSVDTCLSFWGFSSDFSSRFSYQSTGGKIVKRITFENNVLKSEYQIYEYYGDQLKKIIWKYNTDSLAYEFEYDYQGNQIRQNNYDYSSSSNPVSFDSIFYQDGRVSLVDYYNNNTAPNSKGGFQTFIYTDSTVLVSFYEWKPVSTSYELVEQNKFYFGTVKNPLFKYRHFDYTDSYIYHFEKIPEKMENTLNGYSYLFNLQSNLMDLPTFLDFYGIDEHYFKYDCPN